MINKILKEARPHCAVISVLLERRVLLRASRLRLLTQTAEALRQLLYPFRFLHTYIPVMPSVLVDYVEIYSSTICATRMSNCIMLAKKGREDKSMPAKWPCAPKKGPLTSKLATVSPKGPQTYTWHS
eukprot:1143051-Pelagomonas_calceolata.AAC.1